MSRRITELYAFLVQHGPNDESIYSTDGPDGIVPLIFPDTDLLGPIGKIARESAAATGKSIVLAKFSVREDMETFAG